MAGYLGSVPVPQATQHRETFTATAGQTSFATAGYTPQFIDVYLNGVHLSPADVTATNGSDVVLAACLVNDIVDVVSYTPFEVASQTFTGTTTMDVAAITGVVTANAGVVVDTMTLDAATLTATGDFTVDAAGDVVLDAAGNDIKFFVGGSAKGRFTHSSGDFVIQADVQDKDIIFKGDDGGAGITALTLDMSAAGRAFFNSHIDLPDDSQINYGAGTTAIRGNSTSDVITLITNNNTAVTVDSIGAVTMPLQPAFLATPANNDQTNLSSGNHTVVLGTEVFDQNSDFASNTFTAPVAGRYQLNAIFGLRNLDTAATYYVNQIVTSNRAYELQIAGGNVLATDGNFYFTISALADMDAGDTAFMRVQTTGGTAQTDINSDTRFSGFLAC